LHPSNGYGILLATAGQGLAVGIVESGSAYEEHVNEQYAGRVDPSAAAQQWLAELETEAGRLRTSARRAGQALGPSLPIQEIEQAAAALHDRIIAGKALAPALAAGATPQESDPPAMRAMLDREDQGRRLAQALESALGQLLANAVVELTYSEPLLDSDPAAVRAGIRQLRGELQEGLERLRWIVADLRPPSLLGELGLGPSLARYARRFADHTGLSISTQALENFTGRLPASMELAIFRILQQALQNAHAHARAGRVEIGAAPANGGWVFYVEDNGRGFETQQVGNSPGLLDMQGRSRAIGGVLHVTSGNGGGTRVAISVAYPPAAE